jgi:hypothetical protein
MIVRNVDFGFPAIIRTFYLSVAFLAIWVMRFHDRRFMTFCFGGDLTLHWRSRMRTTCTFYGVFNTRIFPGQTGAYQTSLPSRDWTGMDYRRFFFPTYQGKLQHVSLCFLLLNTPPTRQFTIPRYLCGKYQNHTFSDDHLTNDEKTSSSSPSSYLQK